MVKKTISLLLFLVIFNSGVYAMPIIDREAIERIGSETEKALINKDEAALLKYIHPKSKMIIQGKSVSYEEYKSLIKMTLKSMGKSDVKSEELSLQINKEKNTATVETKTVAIMEMMGMKMKDVSLNRTTYGVIDGEIKIIESEDTAISSGPID